MILAHFYGGPLDGITRVLPEVRPEVLCALPQPFRIDARLPDEEYAISLTGVYQAVRWQMVSDGSGGQAWYMYRGKR